MSKTKIALGVVALFVILITGYFAKTDLLKGTLDYSGEENNLSEEKTRRLSESAMREEEELAALEQEFQNEFPEYERDREENQDENSPENEITTRKERKYWEIKNRYQREREDKSGNNTTKD